jgi:chromosome segregation ATPase
LLENASNFPAFLDSIVDYIHLTADTLAVAFAVKKFTEQLEPSMEVDVRLAQLEQQSGTIQRDGAEIKADMRRLDGKIDALKDAVGSLTVKCASIEAKQAAVEAWLESKFETMQARFESRFDAMENRFGAIENRFDAKLSALESSMIKWMVGTIIAAVALACGVAKFVV